MFAQAISIREDLKALNKRLNDPKEQRFYKKSLEINRREDLKTGASANLLERFENLRDKNKPHPLDRLMHTELATEISESANEYNETKIKNYYAHPEAETQRKFQKLLNMDLSPLAKASRSNDLDNFKLAYYSAIENALIEGLDQNKDFFTLLLNNEEIKKSVLGIFSGEIYNSLRNA